MRRPRHSTVANFERLERRDCPAVVGIGGSQTLEENGGPVTLTVRLSGAQPTPVEVRYLSFGSATVGADYRIVSGGRTLASSGALTFSPGQTAIPITVTPINDTVREGTESMTFQLISVRGHTLGERVATLTILDDDNYTATLLGPTQIAPEQSGAFTLQLSSPATKNEVFYVSTRDGTATSRDDYYPIKDLPVTFIPGQSARSFTLRTKANTPGEFDEFYRLSVRPASAGFPAIPDYGVVIPGLGPAPGIGPEPAPTISIGNASGNEGNSGTQTLVFDVSLSKAFTQLVTVDYATADGTATVAENDYTATSGRLVFLPGQTRKTISVSVIGDTKHEADETFALALSAPTNATIANGTGNGTIVNDDPSPVPSISVFDITEAEGSDPILASTLQLSLKTFSFTVALSNPSTIPVFVDYDTLDGTAVVGWRGWLTGDYERASGRLEFAPGVTSRTIEVTVLGDTVNEQDETFFLRLSNPRNATILRGTATATVTNDDPPPPSIPVWYLLPQTAQVVEGTGGFTSIQFALMLALPKNYDSSRGVQVSVSPRAGTASNNLDFSVPVVTYNWRVSGPTPYFPELVAFSVNMSITGDSLREGNETFFIDLTSPTGGSMVSGVGGTATVVIVDDD